MIDPQAAPVTVKPPLPVAIWHHPVTRFLAFIAVYIALELAITLLLIPAKGFFHAHRSWIDPINSVLGAMTAVVALWVMLRWAERRRMGDAGFTLRGVTTETITGYLIGMAFISTVIGVLALCGVYRVFGTNPHFHPWYPLLAYLLVSVVEETIFRGYLLRVMDYRYGSLVAVIVSSAVFGVVHLLNLLQVHIPFYQGLVGAVYIALEAGVPLAAAYIATRRLWLPIGIHWAWNYFESPVYGVPDSGTTDPNVLYRSSLHGPFWLSGGGFGPEASVVCVLIGLVLGFLLLRVAFRSGQWKPAGEWKPQSEPRSVAVASAA